MGWQDRGYNQGREEMYSYFANPASLLQWSLPLYKGTGFYIRLHFWFILFAVFEIASVLRTPGPLYYIPINIAVMLAAVLLHELGHRVFARMVGGNHWEWLVWPLGGMIPPTAPNRPWPTFVANIGGILFSLPIGILCYVGLMLISGGHVLVQINHYPIIPIPVPMSPLSVAAGFTGRTGLDIFCHVLSQMVISCAAITFINLFPASWFDGAKIWQSILWPKFGAWKATTITCMAGMILSVPLILMSLPMGDFLGLVVWGLIFADCFQRRRALLAAGPGVMEDDDSPTYNYMDPPTKRRKIKKRWFNAARKRARLEQQEQAKIDSILAKVKEKGLHSLTWGEKAR